MIYVLITVGYLVAMAIALGIQYLGDKNSEEDKKEIIENANKNQKKLDDKVDKAVEAILKNSKKNPLSIMEKYGVTEEQIQIYAKEKLLFSDSKINQGDGYFLLKKYDLAEKEYSEAIALEPNNAKAYFKRATSLYMETLNPNQDSFLLIGNPENRVHNIDSDITLKLTNDYNKAISLNNNLADAYYYRGNIKLIQGDYSNALADFNKAIELNPKDYDYFNARGMTYSDFGDISGNSDFLTKSLSDFSSAISLKPDNPIYYYNKAIVYSRLKDYKNDLVFYTKAIQLNSKYTEAFYARGTTYSILGKKESAINDLTRTISLDNNFIDAFYNRGNCYLDLNQFKLAIDDFSQVIKKDKNYTRAYFNRAGSYFKIGNYNLAIEDYDEVIKREPNDPHAKHLKQKAVSYLK